MSKIFFLFLAFVLAGCSSCAHHTTKLWDPMGDPDATYTQQLLRETVEVDHHITVLVPDVENSVEGQAMKYKSGSEKALGTGTVVAVRGNESLVVTAAHVCAPKETIVVPLVEGISVEVPVLGERYTVWTIDMNELDAVPLVIDNQNDICVMKVSGKAGDVAPVAKQDPPIGAMVTAVGNPQGFLNYHRAFVVDGRFVGSQFYSDTDRHTDIVAVPATHGCSGGGVFYHGELWGVQVRVREDFKEVVLIEGDASLRDAVKKAKELWK